MFKLHWILNFQILADRMNFWRTSDDKQSGASEQFWAIQVDTLYGHTYKG